MHDTVTRAKAPAWVPEPVLIPGTVLLDLGYRPRGAGAYAGVAFDPGVTVQVGWDGLIQYAVIGTAPDRVWWFAGAGDVYETPQ